MLNLRQYTSSLSSSPVAGDKQFDFNSNPGMSTWRGAGLASADIEMAFNQVHSGERTRLPDRPFASDGFILGNLGAPLVDFDDSEGYSFSHENEGEGPIDMNSFKPESQPTISNC